MENEEETDSQGDASKVVPKSDPVAEAHILEEHIVTPAPAKAPEASTPPPQVPSSPVTPPPSQKPPPAMPPRIPILPSDKTGLKNDIAGILKEVKLPERGIAQPVTQQEEAKPHKVYDTQLPGEGRPAEVVTDPSKGVQAIDPQIRAANTPNSAPQPSKADIPSVHTLKDDLQDVVREKKISIVRAAALQEEKRARTESAPDTRSKRRTEHMTFTIFVSVLLVGLGLLAIGAVYIVMQDRTSSSPPASEKQLLFAEQTVPLPIDNLPPGDVERTLAAARTSGVLTLGAIIQIVPVITETNPATNDSSLVPTTFSQFLAALGARAPSELARALSDNFFLGLHTVDESAPVLVLPVTSYERAFAAMLSWEDTMNDDLAPFFTDVSNQTLGTDGLPKDRTFEDSVMRNYDVRILRDDSGTIQLYYSFPTRNILIIAESPYSFAEVLSRLRADRRL